MCGIVGVAGTLTGNIDKLFINMLQMDVLRGEDSVGVAALGKAKKFKNKILKSTSLPTHFVKTKNFDKAIRRQNQVLLGHNRAATRGVVSAVNAHPFQHHHIIGVHNGTLTDQTLLPNHEKFAVDSDNLFYALSLENIDKVYKKCKGALSIVWWDCKTKKLNFLRNTLRPMCYVFTKDKKALLWASEAWMIYGAASRCKIALDGDVKTTKTHHHYEFAIPERQQAFKDPEVEELKPFTYTASNNSYYTRTRVGHFGSIYGYQEDPWETYMEREWAKRKKEKEEAAKKGNKAPVQSQLGEVKPTQDHKPSVIRPLVPITPRVIEPNQFTVPLVPKKDDYISFTLNRKTFTSINVWMDGEDMRGNRVRLYFKNVENLRKFNYDKDTIFVGKIKDMYSFCTIEPTSLRMLNVPSNTKLNNDVPPEEGMLIEDHSGNKISEKEFSMRYESCVWCKEDIEFTDKNLYLSKFEALCPKCQNVKSVTSKLKCLIN